MKQINWLIEWKDGTISVWPVASWPAAIVLNLSNASKVTLL
jgi:hypothetical protein